MWNDTNVPLAVFFTFRTHGTWLHGDDRGSVDRNNNIYRTPPIPSSARWKKYNEALLKDPPVRLDADRRRSTEIGIRCLCDRRGFYLHAVNVRTNHVHSVINILGKDPDPVLSALKAYATRQMRADGCWTSETSPWAEKGSRRRLWNERSVWEACDYVVNRQGADLTQYDWW